MSTAMEASRRRQRLDLEQRGHDVPSIPQHRTVTAKRDACTYLVNRLVKAGRPVGLKLGERTTAPASTRLHRLKLLRELAIYGKDQIAP